MSKTTAGFLLIGFAILLGFGSCAVYAATYGEAASIVVIAVLVGLLLSVALFLFGAYLVVLGTARK